MYVNPEIKNSKDGAILCCETVAFVHQRLCCGGFVSLMRGVAGVLIADAYASGVAGALLQLVSCCLRHCLKKNFLTVLCSRWDLSPLGWNPHSLHWKHGVLTSGLPSIGILHIFLQWRKYGLRDIERDDCMALMDGR
ncbi:uncharacterized protein LOC129619891 isoform X1 [Bubalus kerabau]|uniref:uncharacterized protein LOC129619891 isoform X1 n=1 Tax=Bubalus carabanensis TaxID=3119969 RepID=UPI00244E930A|nr:uncharacterized protein LOC129619891 isoform X1 [Bubalus carabanensis]XP_055391331.1 uncharacterized protein LOC129619891 isoform X1 [Bubalus carabanensis]XP_055391332.1 uncharacterized protein LOC129619891 isoform X1 [Bubalus carabanensis]XP_055391333.1 uncharacterized protein LOC129619891 isoform X1 [Bubalus carabanensis]